MKLERNNGNWKTEKKAQTLFNSSPVAHKDLNLDTIRNSEQNQEVAAERISEQLTHTKTLIQDLV